MNPLTRYYICPICEELGTYNSNEKFPGCSVARNSLDKEEVKAHLRVGKKLLFTKEEAEDRLAIGCLKIKGENIRRKSVPISTFSDDSLAWGYNDIGVAADNTTTNKTRKYNDVILADNKSVFKKIDITKKPKRKIVLEEN